MTSADRRRKLIEILEDAVVRHRKCVVTADVVEWYVIRDRLVDRIETLYAEPEGATP